MLLTDGTPAGTVRVPARPIISYYNDAMRPVPFGGRLPCSSFLPVGDRLYFNGFQPQTGAELWVMEEK
jgi:hypothetical protein